MDLFYSSGDGGEDFNTKARKPYTITKQRERWTDDEHNRFLDALKLYGRAWQRIEEHIGTKTAVQIRSHAQKFFSKLEKEAVTNGVPLSKALHIDIPPPRPKRKPSNPYPRKTSTGSPSSEKDGKPLKSASLKCDSKKVLDLENNPFHEKLTGQENSEAVQESLFKDNSSEVLALFQEASCSFISSASVSKSTVTHVSQQSPVALKEFIPLVNNQDGALVKSFVTMNSKRVLKLNMTDAFDTDLDNGSKIETLVQQENQNEIIKQSNCFGPSSPEDTQNYPNNVPVHVVERTAPVMPKEMINQFGTIQGNPNLNSTVSAATETHTHYHSNISMSSIQPNLLPCLTPPLNNGQDTYQAVDNMSSTFSNLIISTLLQNPAAHAAASLAASFWPYRSMENYLMASSEHVVREESSLSSNMATLAATTIAAASAWWATHGMFPLPPLNIGFNYIPIPTSGAPTNPEPTHLANGEMKDTSPCQILDQKNSEALKRQHAVSTYPHQSSSDSEEPNTGNYKQKQTAVPIESNKEKTIRGQVDRSSCGSNTASSSEEAETDTLEKNETGKEDLKELPNALHQGGELNSYRSRSTSNYINEPWKEVSEEGRVAFRALFSRDVLPQSFPLMQDNHNTNIGGKDTIELDLNMSTMLEKNKLCLEVGHGKQLKVGRRTGGFKPYKRCSVEAAQQEESNKGVEERGPKRIRLDAQTSLL